LIKRLVGSRKRGWAGDRAEEGGDCYVRVVCVCVALLRYSDGNAQSASGVVVNNKWWKFYSARSERPHAVER